MRVGVLLGERPDLLQALLDVAEIEVVAVARDRSEADAPPPYGLPRDLFGWWPERGSGARERREEAVARWFRARGVELVVAAGSGCSRPRSSLPSTIASSTSTRRCCPHSPAVTPSSVRSSTASASTA
jgi:hypothetical protein